MYKNSQKRTGYILEIRERELTTLAKKLGFLDSYNCLLNERFGNNLQVKINVPTEVKHLQILPLSLQMLFENAIKHNVVSTQDPLHIEVFVEKGDRLVVKIICNSRNRSCLPRELGWKISKSATASLPKKKWK